MSRSVHFIYLGILVSVVLAVVLLLARNGYSYYILSAFDRIDHPSHSSLRSSGLTGHGYGIAGSVSILTGVTIYMARKRYRFLARLGHLKHWLEFHIFLCTLGPILILFHTSFRFGGLVAVSFWSMTAVFLSGIFGRFIYIRIPKSDDGRILTISELREMHQGGGSGFSTGQLPEQRERKILRLQTHFRYWHVVHLPFAFIMLVIMLIHVGVTVLFGYRWIF